MLDNEIVIITAESIPESERMQALPFYFKNHMLAVEKQIYSCMHQFCQGHNGGFWDFYRLDNGGFYMACHSKARYFLSSPMNEYQKIVDADTAGMIVCLYAYNFLCCKTESDILIEQYYKLLDYVHFHPHAQEIFKAID